MRLFEGLYRSAGTGTVPIGTNVILSHHDYKGTPTNQQLDSLVAKMFQSGADIAKIASTATDVSDSLRMLQLPGRSEGSRSLAKRKKGFATPNLHGVDDSNAKAQVRF